jgi:alpha-1,2-mannosyltransferase
MGLSRPLRWAVAVLAVVLTVVSASWFVRQAHEWPVAGLDGRVYRDAARSFLDREDVYSGRFQGLPFTYPPFALLVFVPLALVPENAATLLMFAASAAALVAVVRWCQDYATRGRAGSWWLTVALAAPAAVAVEPVRTTLSLGQVNVLLLALVLGLDARATRWSGVGAGLATAIKIAPGLLVAAQAVRSDWRAFGRGVLAFAIATALAAALAPAATRTYFTSLLWDSSRPGGLDYLQNQSLRGVLARHLPDHGSIGWLVGAVLVLALGAWVVRRHRRDPFYALTAAGLTGLLVSPVSWSHHWVWVLPIVAVGVRSGRRSPVAWTALALLASTIIELLYWTSGDAPLATQDMYVVLGLAWLVAAAVTVPSPEDPASVPAQKADAVGSTS